MKCFRSVSVTFLMEYPENLDIINQLEYAINTACTELEQAKVDVTYKLVEEPNAHS